MLNFRRAEVDFNDFITRNQVFSNGSIFCHRRRAGYGLEQVIIIILRLLCLNDPITNLQHEKIVKARMWYQLICHS